MARKQNPVDVVFNNLRSSLESLHENPQHDNEATRHDRLIVPVLTNPLLLGWDRNDLASQALIKVPNQITESHVFRGSQPKFRKPDILVTSPLIKSNAFVVEEKYRQASIDALNNHRIQLIEYQSLYECVWGLLTDGECWILKKGFESYHEFASLEELRASLADIQNCIGKDSLQERALKYGTCDLVIVVPSQHLQLPDPSAHLRTELLLLRDRMVEQWHRKSGPDRRKEFLSTNPSARTATVVGYAMYRVRFRVDGPISHEIRYDTKTSHRPEWHWPDGSTFRGEQATYKGETGMATVDLVAWADLRVCTIKNFIVFE